MHNTIEDTRSPNEIAQTPKDTRSYVEDRKLADKVANLEAY